MVETIKQVEGIPAAYPATPSGLTDKAAALDANMIWQRIEAYTAHRFSVRDVLWLIEAQAGDQWEVPLTPLIASSAERWWDEWTAVDLLPGPLGLCFPSSGMFQITGQVGAGPVPAAVQQAFVRLAEYYAGGRSTVNEPGAANFDFKMDEIEWSVQRNPAHIARAMQNSGAADLLRPYRRA